MINIENNFNCFEDGTQLDDDTQPLDEVPELSGSDDAKPLAPRRINEKTKQPVAKAVVKQPAAKAVVKAKAKKAPKAKAKPASAGSGQKRKCIE